MDPVKDGGNWYQYVYSNPIAYMDPNGLWVIAVGGAFAAGALISMGEGTQLIYNPLTGDIALFAFSTKGASSPALSKGISISFYNADNMEELEGLSYAYGAGVNGSAIGGIAPVKGSVEISHGRTSDGSLIWGITFSGAPMELIPVEFHAVEVNAKQLLSGNVYEMIQNTLNSIWNLFKKVTGYFKILTGCS